MSSYSSSFYSTYASESQRSAEAFVHLLMEEVAPESVLDIGCGVGTWLRAFLDAGVETVVGVDGPYVAQEDLLIPAGRFVARDLRAPVELPPALPQTFDLAISMEVGEHLPDAASRTLVRSLTAHAPVVLFSAAIPHQGGTDHINEQWQRYWARRFADEGYATVDRFPEALWEADGVAYYYVQNALLFVHEDRLAELEALHPYRVDADAPSLDRVHPERWMEANDPRRQTLKHVLAALPHALRAAIGRRLPSGTR